MAGAKLPALPKLLYPKTGTSTAHKRTTWAGTMGISVVTSVDKGLAGLALAPSQVLEALPNPEKDRKPQQCLRLGFPPPSGKGTAIS